MKKFLAVLLTLSMIFCFIACADKGDNNETTKPSEEGSTKNEASDTVDYDAIPDQSESKDGKYEIAFVTDVGMLKDKSFNQGTWEGLKKYATDNAKTYKYYQPANASNATDDDRYNAMKAAVDSGAKIVVCAGFMQGTALTKAAAEFTDVKFVFIDGWVINGEDEKPLANVAAIDFKEDQVGYLAGYAAVKEGFEKLGFSGGGGGKNPACLRFGYGFVQGADAAAKELNKTVDMNYSWLYGESFQASTDLQTMLEGWFEKGTEVVFSAGGAMCQSAFGAAAANDAAVIGVDVDQSNMSDTVITSATKGLREAVIFALDKFYTDKFDEIGGVQTSLGVKENAVGLPKDTWSFEHFTLEEYDALYKSVKDGSVKVDNDYAKLSNEAFPNVNLNVVE